jgi:predicted ferric reductase
VAVFVEFVLYVDFYYCVVKANEAHFDEELQALAKKNPSFQAHLFCQDKQGFMNADVLTKGRSIQKIEFFICGPPPMMKALHDGLLAKGVPDKHIHFEDFSLR